MFSLVQDLLDDHPYHRSNFGVFPGLVMDSNPRVYYHVARPRRQTSLTSSAKPDSNKYQVMLNVKHFRPEEIDVKIVDDTVIVNCKHEEQADEHGFVSRQFTRRYQLPDDVDPDTVKSSFNQNGVLTIEAPRKQLEPPPTNERIVPITIQRPAGAEEVRQLQDQQDVQPKATEEQ